MQWKKFTKAEREDSLFYVEKGSVNQIQEMTNEVGIRND